MRAGSIDWGRRLRAALAVAMLALSAAAPCPAAAQDDGGEILVVGTREAPPVVIREADGRWSGLSIALWERIAGKLGRRFEWREVDAGTMIAGVAAGDLDLSIAAESMSFAREAEVDFSYPYYHSGLGMAVAGEPWDGVTATFRALASREFIITVILLCTLSFVAGALVWLTERRRNGGTFDPAPGKGLGSGFWWAAVTMTTVGYGDKVPITLRGRLLATFWMFCALILTAVVTAQLSANMNAQRLDLLKQSPRDLAHLRIGVVEGGMAQAAVHALGAEPVGYADVAAGLSALTEDGIAAFVHDAPALIWESAGLPEVTVTDFRLLPLDYAIVLPEGAALREDINRALLDLIGTAEWAAVVQYYFGQPQDW